jgi:Ca2+-binding RTX toxin-like protein
LDPPWEDYYPYDDIGLRGYWGNDYFVGGWGSDTMVGGAGRDTFEGSAGDDSMYRGYGNDTFYPGQDGPSDNDYASGGYDNDIYYAQAGGFNSFYGGPGIDWVIFGYLNSSAVTVDLENNALNTGVAQFDTYSDVENLRGSYGADTLKGNDRQNTLEGGPGIVTDTLYGRGGYDTLRGGDGDDDLFGGADGDLLDGGDGSDTADYFDAPYRVIADLIFPGSNAGYALGDNYISIENLIGSQFDDGLGGDSGANIILGGAGNDFIGGRGGNDSLWGETGDDTLTGDADADELHGGTGTDWAIYWYAPSFVFADLLFPGLNAGEAAGDTYDQIENLGGSQFADHLGGDNNPNVIFGLDGNDLIAGRGGQDQLFGEIGNDTLIGDAGNDALDGGTGIDTAVFSGPRSAYTITRNGAEPYHWSRRHRNLRDPLLSLRHLAPP